MVIKTINRRAILAGLAGAVVLPQVAFAKKYMELEWEDLLPEDDTIVPEIFAGFIDHTTAPISNQQPASTGVRLDLNGENVRIPGFVVPITYDSTGVSEFILVPYAGACIHVPPPPANQLVFVSTSTPYESQGLYEPINVAGKLSVSSVSTQIAQVGYALIADKVEPY